MKTEVFCELSILFGLRSDNEHSDNESDNEHIALNIQFC